MTGKPEPEKALLFSRCGDAGDPAAATIAEALAAEVASRFGPRDEAALSIRAHDAQGALVAGLAGATHWRWCYIRHFWVAPGWRGGGIGRRLLAEAEAEALSRGCVGLYLDTFDPAAARFYARCGFAPFGVIDGFPPGAARTFLAKRLSF